MSVTDILHEIDTLPTEERWKVLEHARHLVEPEIPYSFRNAMAEIQQGEVADLDEILKGIQGTE